MKQVFGSKKEEAIDRENVYYWMKKYISLLEKYNELLIQRTQREMEKREKRDERQDLSG